ncbi:FMN-binding negative transcriptional regulator [Marinicella meishanensis]|uniref:FMN-binding negative transcriptional regulator n=1 Tax=Marinicella meishanensis TaxID=2873263 RepID=UPI001CBFE2BB|nr:FMN-binding negative transcriptional regulator [Marinicella sp. NBU2979]
MYSPKAFAVGDQGTLDRFIRDHSFGQLISSHQGRLFSTHLPFLYAAKAGTLTGHLAKQNPQHQDLAGQEVMVTLSGPHGYISPTWYAVNSVPTWNYQAVHIWGRCQMFEEADRLSQLVNDLTAQHERTQPQPWQPEYPTAMLQAIVGIEITITEVRGKFKLNQNRSVADMQGVIEHLDPVNDAELLAAMQQALRDKQAAP